MKNYKLLKNASYFSKFIVKLRRFRNKKTNKSKSILLNKNKSFLYRKYLVDIRKTNTRIIINLKYKTLIGDFILESSNTKHLEKFGYHFGNKNTFSGYFVGFLLSRRVNLKFKLNHVNIIIPSVDIGYHNMTSGCTISSVIKGLLDGGLFIPFSKTIFSKNINYNEKTGEVEQTSFFYYFIKTLEFSKNCHNNNSNFIVPFINDLFKVYKNIYQYCFINIKQKRLMYKIVWGDLRLSLKEKRTNSILKVINYLTL